MPMLLEKDKKGIQERLKELTGEVKLVNFTEEGDCRYCRETTQLLTEVTELTDKITLEVYNFETDKLKVKEYRIDKVPATAVAGAKDYGIRFYGIPSGHEFATLLDDIVAVSNGQSGLSPETQGELREIDQPVHIQVFTTPG